MPTIESVQPTFLRSASVSAVRVLAYVIVFLAAGFQVHSSLRAAEPQRQALWPKHIRDSKSAITVHLAGDGNGAAVVICPGGGYGGLVTGAEGHGIAKWLNKHGVTGIVLEYELPKGRSEIPLRDAQRAIRMVRAHAREWKIDKQKIGVIGFSAGGHLASTVGTHFDDGDRDSPDQIARESCRPDFMLLVYPVISMGKLTHGGSKRNLLGANPSPESIRRFSNELQVTGMTPPAFLAHAKDDKAVTSANSEVFYKALQDKGVASEYLELPRGGHGLNGYRGPMWDAWQAAALRWLSKEKFIPNDVAQQTSLGKGPLQVFILAGQSNMEGQGVVDLDHPKYYNGGRGTLNRVRDDPKKAAAFRHAVNAQGEWIERDDVWCRFQTRRELKKGKLGIGFAGYPGRHHIGPEFQFGHVVGEAVEDPVLLIKTAWGGKSLHKDFRPPSSQGETGEYYAKMIAEVREALEKLQHDFPQLREREPQLAGFVWFQGWNDAFNQDAKNEYTANLVNLINDVRSEFKSPRLPVVIGELGNGGEKASGGIKAIRAAQAAAAKSFAADVRFVKTTDFARPAEDSPNTGHGHHWFGNAESYFLIGDALGRAMVELRQEAGRR